MKISSVYRMAVAALFAFMTNTAIAAASEDLLWCFCAPVNDGGTGLDLLTGFCDPSIETEYSRTRLRAPKSGEVFSTELIKTTVDVSQCNVYINDTAGCIDDALGNTVGPREPHVCVGSPALP